MDKQKKIAKFTISYYYKKYPSGDIDKRHTRTACVYASKLLDALKKIRDFDSEYISVADSGVSISEIGGGKNESSSTVG